MPRLICPTFWGQYNRWLCTQHSFPKPVRCYPRRCSAGTYREKGWSELRDAYELYQARLLGGALDYLDALPLKDRPVLMGAAAKRGYLLTLAEEERALEARDVLMSELTANDC